MVLPLISGSPGIYKIEDDQSGFIQGVATSIACFVFPTKKGSLLPQIQTSSPSFTENYGLSDISWGYGHLCAKQFLKAGTNRAYILGVRGHGVKYASSSLTYLAPISGSSYLDASQFASPGTTNGYDTDGVLIYHTLLSQSLINGSSVSGSIESEGVSVSITPVAYTGDNLSTFTAVTQSIGTALIALNSLIASEFPGQLDLAPPSASLLNADYGIIRIVAPESAPLEINLSVDNGTAGTTFETYNSNLIDVFAENPGAWGNSLGWNITNIDTGIVQRASLTFTGPLVVGNVVTLNMFINGNLNIIGPYTVANGQSSDQAIANIITLINQAVNNGSSNNAAATYPGNFGSNYARVINLIAPNAGPAILNLQSSSVTGGNSQPSILFKETLAGVASSGTFNFNVYKRGNIRYPVGSYKGSLTPQLDGYQDQLFLEDVINTSAKKSSVIRVVVNKAMVASGVIIDPQYAAKLANITFLSGGDDGSLPTTSDLINGWNTFIDNEKYKVNILVNSGFTDPALQGNMVEIATTRQDCMAILDVPANMQGVNDAVTWRTQISNINSRYASISASDGLVLDTDTNQYVYCPRSGLDAARWAYTDKNFATWFSPAGYDRGYLPDVTEFRVVYSKPDRDILDALQINCGKQTYDGSGRLIFGDNTSQVSPSLLSSLAVARSLLYIENSIAYSIERYLFSQNSVQLGFLIRKKIESFLQPIKDGQGLKDFFVVIGASNNPGVFADAGQLNVSVYMIPIRPVKIILLQSVILPSSISFNESVINGSL